MIVGECDCRTHGSSALADVEDDSSIGFTKLHEGQSADTLPLVQALIGNGNRFLEILLTVQSRFHVLGKGDRDDLLVRRPSRNWNWYGNQRACLSLGRHAWRREVRGDGAGHRTLEGERPQLSRRFPGLTQNRGR